MPLAVEKMNSFLAKVHGQSFARGDYWCRGKVSRPCHIVEVIDLTVGCVRVTLMPTAFSRAERSPDMQESAHFADLAEQVLERFRPRCAADLPWSSRLPGADATGSDELRRGRLSPP